MNRTLKSGMIRRPADIRIHPTAEVAADAIIGEGARIWNNAQIREEVRLGSNVMISKNVYIDHGVRIGWVCGCGSRLVPDGPSLRCPQCSNRFLSRDSSIMPFQSFQEDEDEHDPATVH